MWVWRGLHPEHRTSQLSLPEASWLNSTYTWHLHVCISIHLLSKATYNCQLSVKSGPVSPGALGLSTLLKAYVVPNAVVLIPTGSSSLPQTTDMGWLTLDFSFNRSQVQPAYMPKASRALLIGHSKKAPTHRTRDLIQYLSCTSTIQLAKAK